MVYKLFYTAYVALHSNKNPALILLPFTWCTMRRSKKIANFAANLLI